MKMLMILDRSPQPEEMSNLDFLADGSLALKQERNNLEFAFRACGLTFSATTRMIDSGPVLQIAADIAADPYSAEGIDMRNAVHAIIQSSHAAPACRLMVSRQKRIFCVGRMRLDHNSTPTSLLSAAAELTLEARPYLMVLRDVLPNWPKPAQA